MITGSGNLKLSLAVLLSRQHHVTVIDGNPGNVEMINNHVSPVQDEYISNLLTEKDLDLTASTDAENVRKNADLRCDHYSELIWNKVAQVFVPTGRSIMSNSAFRSVRNSRSVYPRITVPLIPE